MSSHAASYSLHSPRAVARRNKAFTLVGSSSRTLVHSAWASRYCPIWTWQWASLSQHALRTTTCCCWNVGAGAMKCSSRRASRYLASAAAHCFAFTMSLPSFLISSARFRRAVASLQVTLGAFSIRRWCQTRLPEAELLMGRHSLRLSVTSSPMPQTFTSESMPEEASMGRFGCGATQLTTHRSAGRRRRSCPVCRSQINREPQSPPVHTWVSSCDRFTSFAQVWTFTRPRYVCTTALVSTLTPSSW
mmetsp:Transcript_74373/g.131366  ORF Transcript_74373/g.131366 Transcript_74373/m.131366 type:complete len:247 (+) Transcript_74373:922-1662(+)